VQVTAVPALMYLSPGFVSACGPLGFPDAFSLVILIVEVYLEPYLYTYHIACDSFT